MDGIDERCKHYDGHTPCGHHPGPWRRERRSDGVWHILDAHGEFVREVFGDDADEYSERLVTESADGAADWAAVAVPELSFDEQNALEAAASELNDCILLATGQLDEITVRGQVDLTRRAWRKANRVLSRWLRQAESGSGASEKRQQGDES